MDAEIVIPRFGHKLASKLIAIPGGLVLLLDLANIRTLWYSNATDWNGVWIGGNVHA